MYCRKCGKELEPGSDFCANCGTRVSSEHELIQLEKSQGSISVLSKPVSTYAKKVFDMIRKQSLVSIVVGIAVVISIFTVFNYYSTRCHVSGCSEKADYGNYCIQHVCLAAGCTKQASYGSHYCYSHKKEYDSSATNASADLKFSNISVDTNSSYTVCTGKITNNGSRIYTFVEVKGAFKDKNGEVVDTDWTYAVGSEGLAPGESATFRLSVPKDYSVETCSVSILDYD